MSNRGETVAPDTVLFELSNPQVDQELQDATLKARSAEASLESLRVQLRTERLQSQVALAGIAAEHQKAAMQAEMNEALAVRQLVSELVRRQSRLDAEQWAARERLTTEQDLSRAEAGQAQLAVQQLAVDQAHAIEALKRHQHDELSVRAGLRGVVQSIAVVVGQQVAPGTNLARVADPRRLKAVVKIPETQAKDLAVGLPATVDTHNGVIAGRIARVDPGVEGGTRTVDVALAAALPAGAVPDLSVDGVIELERVPQTLMVGRPAVGDEGQTLSLFRVDADGRGAMRVPVRVGRTSVSAIEVTSGVRAGERVILSDMSTWDGVDRIRLR
ncbi:MAG: efflux RND transporter periplasmic adaptor subunit [Vicinamibacterales bacterium]